MTCALNEVACAAFSVGALVDLVDLYVFVDTGSTDGTAELIKHLYSTPCQQGRLIVDELGPLPGYDLSIARNHALEILRRAEIDYLIKVDADDVFYDSGAARVVETARSLPAEITHVSCLKRELYQWEVPDTREWLEAIRDGRPVFWEMAFIPSQERVFAVAGAEAFGGWVDEAAGRPAENFAFHRPVAGITLDGIVGAHYGWARPVKRKREKAEAWYGGAGADPRVETLHLVDDWRKPETRFSAHPAIFDRQVRQVLAWLDGRVRERSTES